MPNRALQYKKWLERIFGKRRTKDKYYGVKHKWSADRRKNKGVMRLPAERVRIRGEMMERLRQEVKKREIRALLDKQEFGVTKQRKARRR